jgi:hypothetical protein
MINADSASAPVNADAMGEYDLCRMPAKSGGGTGRIAVQELSIQIS